MCGRRADVECRDDLVAIVLKRNGDGAKTDFQLLVDDRIALVTHSADFGHQFFRVGSRMRCVCLEIRAGEHVPRLLFRQGGEPHAPIDAQ